KKSFLEKNDIDFSNQRVGQDVLFNYDAYSFVETILIDNKSYYYYDVSREGSAVKTYRNDRAEFEINIADAYVNMFEYWNMRELFSKNILLSYWRVVIVELRNLSFQDGNVLTNNNIDRLTRIVKKNKVCNSI